MCRRGHRGGRCSLSRPGQAERRRSAVAGAQVSAHRGVAVAAAGGRHRSRLALFELRRRPGVMTLPVADDPDRVCVLWATCAPCDRSWTAPLARQPPADTTIVIPGPVSGNVTFIAEEASQGYGRCWLAVPKMMTPVKRCCQLRQVAESFCEDTGTTAPETAFEFITEAPAGAAAMNVADCYANSRSKPVLDERRDRDTARLDLLGSMLDGLGWTNEARRDRSADTAGSHPARASFTRGSR